MVSKLHPIQIAAARAGLSPELLRAWEKRYRAVVPARTRGGQRVYSDTDIQRLRLLRRAIEAGRRIGSVASLPTDELRKLVEEDRIQRPESAAAAPSAETARAAVVRSALTAGLALDGPRLRQLLQRELVLLRPEELIVAVLAPLMREVGVLWHEGNLRPAHEHLISGVVRELLARLISTGQASESRFQLVVTTPARQRHELGAMMAAATAVCCGWRVTYLGADLPMEDIANAVAETGARLLALSFVHPRADPVLSEELSELRKLLPGEVEILAGGAAAESYRQILEPLGGRIVTDLEEWTNALRAIETDRF